MMYWISLLLVTLVSMVNIVTSVWMLKEQHKRTQSPCLLHNNIYVTHPARSKIECAAICENNSFGPCTRLIYDVNKGLCRLHSDVTYPGTTPVSIQTNASWMSYGIAHPGCSKPGYDFIPFVNKCIRHVRQVEKSWKDARLYCQTDGGDLLSFTTQQMWQFLFNYMNCVGKFWAGLRNMVWVNGVTFSNVFQMNVIWNDMPDSENPSDPDYDCGLFATKTSQHLVDVSCNEKLRKFFLCEIPVQE